MPFEDGHTRQLPRLTTGPFRYATHASTYLTAAKRLTTLPVKQAVISASALSLLYPESGIAGYPRDAFLSDLVSEAVADIRGCLDQGADSVQIDFTEGRLSLKLDPHRRAPRTVHRAEQPRSRSLFATRSGGASACTRARAAIATRRTAPMSTMPACCRRCSELRVGRFYVQLASEADPKRVLGIIREHRQPDQIVFVGVTDPINPARRDAGAGPGPHSARRASTSLSRRLGTTDDCGFAPFADDASTSRDIAFEKIRARVAGTALAAIS